jgi:hypothetical protein
VFAGAAREAVFSNPDVIRRVNADFIPVALKAVLVNRPPDDEEGLLYREIGRSKPAPQGLCVVNSAGKVLSWALMFDDGKSLLAFFDHVKERYARSPDAKGPVTAEVYEKFPSRKRQDVEDSGQVLSVPDRHPEGKPCPAEPPLRRGTVAVRLIGRALGKDGKPVADTVRQEHYVEDRFTIDVETQAKLAEALAEAGNSPVTLPPRVVRQWVKQAYMGVLDVQPLDNPGGSKGELKRCDFTATKVRAGEGRMLWRVEGESEAFIDEMANAGPGDMHEVKLRWHGFLEMDGSRMTRLVLSAGGRERLKFNSARGQDENEVALLPGGHRIDMACEVRFGLLGEPVRSQQVAADAPAPAQPEDPRRQLIETLGPPFLVFRDRVQEELNISDEQKRKLEKRLQGTAQDAGRFFQQLGDRKPEEREKELHAYVGRAQENLGAFLEGLLQEGQLKRLRQVMLQREGLFALGNPEVMRELDLTDRQRQQFAEVVQDMQKQVEPLLKEAQNGGRPEDIRPRVMKVREEHAGRIEALLTEAQKKQWQEMLGKPVDLGD